jgi:A/G-specific adenine glycosylase
MTWQSRLLQWYRKHRRDLPWRRTKDPYAIWVSEIMLQQTTVEAVIPYYKRFLKRFPTLETLAEGPEEDVLKLWSGLGYYSRARNLHKAAGMIKKLPDTVEELIRLPGIGRYTAGAIASIAFGRRAPIVDGNVIRVLSRLFAIREDPKSPQGQKIFWGKAEKILPSKHCGDFNQGLMELGATVCSPENPSCLLCPVSADCLARKKGRLEDFPNGRKKTECRDVLMTAAVVLKDGKVLLVQRPAKGLLRGMWEVPMNAGDRLDRWPVEPIRPLRPVKHSVLNRRLTIRPFLCQMKKDGKILQGHRWINPKNINELPTSSMNRKILHSYLGSSGGATIG